MNTYTITCCSTTDMSEQFFETHKVPFACFHFQMDGVDYDDDLGHSMSFDEFYKRIDAGAQPVTSQVNPEEFVTLFEKVLEKGEDLIHISLSSGLSGAYNSAVIAGDLMREKYPNRKITIIDSLSASSGYGMLVSSAVSYKEAGWDYDKLVSWILENRLALNHWFFSSNLASFKRGGRISSTAYVFGSMLNICVLLNVDDEGKLIPQEKHRGKKKVMKEIVSKMEQHARGGLDYDGKCFISNSACLEDAQEVATMIETKFPNLDGRVEINTIGTVIGSHTGPGTVALFFYGDNRST